MFNLAAAPDLMLRGVLLSLAALLWVVVLVRVIGLRSFSKMTAFDFVATVAMGSLLATAATSDSWNGFGQALVAMLALLSAQWLLARGRIGSKRFRHLIGNSPVLLMENGQFCEAALRATRIPREDVLEKIRAANALSLTSVRAVVLENTGDISVLHGQALDDAVMEGVRRI